MHRKPIIFALTAIVMIGWLALCLSEASAADEAGRAAAVEAAGKNGELVFPLGDYNERSKNVFTGDSYVAMLAGNDGVNVANVTFISGAHTFWHIHHGTCQVIMGAAGKGYYQIWGQEPHMMKPGDSVSIPEGTKHWHGAAPGSNFQHVVVTGPAKYTTEWLEEVDPAFFNKLK